MSTSLFHAIHVPPSYQQHYTSSSTTPNFFFGNTFQKSSTPETEPKESNNDNDLTSFKSDDKLALSLANESLTLLLNRSADVNATTKRNETPLLLVLRSVLASKERLYDVVSQLIKSGSLINITDLDGTSPLHIAACRFDSKLFTLLETNEQLNKPDKWNVTPFMQACKMAACPPQSWEFLSDITFDKQREFFEFLSEKEIDVNVQESFVLRAPIHYIVQSPNPQLFSSFIRKYKKLDLNLRDIMDMTPLHSAIEVHNWDVVNKLLKIQCLKKENSKQKKKQYNNTSSEDDEESSTEYEPSVSEEEKNSSSEEEVKDDKDGKKEKEEVKQEKEENDNTEEKEKKEVEEEKEKKEVKEEKEKKEKKEEKEEKEENEDKEKNEEKEEKDVKEVKEENEKEEKEKKEKKEEKEEKVKIVKIVVKEENNKIEEKEKKEENEKKKEKLNVVEAIKDNKEDSEKISIKINDKNDVIQGIVEKEEKEEKTEKGEKIEKEEKTGIEEKDDKVEKTEIDTEKVEKDDKVEKSETEEKEKNTEKEEKEEKTGKEDKVKNTETEEKEKNTEKEEKEENEKKEEKVDKEEKEDNEKKEKENPKKMKKKVVNPKKMKKVEKKVKEKPKTKKNMKKVEKKVKEKPKEKINENEEIEQKIERKDLNVTNAKTFRNQTALHRVLEIIACDCSQNNLNLRDVYKLLRTSTYSKPVICTIKSKNYIPLIYRQKPALVHNPDRFIDHTPAFIETIRCLFDRHDYSATNSNNMLVLHWAFLFLFIEQEQWSYLVMRCAKVISNATSEQLRHQDENGYSPVHYLVSLLLKFKLTYDDAINRVRNVWEEILKIGVDFNLPDNYGNTPLMLACMDRAFRLNLMSWPNWIEKSFFDQMIQPGCDIINRMDGRTALHYFVFSIIPSTIISEQDGKILKKLCTMGNPNFCDYSGMTPLMVACQELNLGVINALISQPMVDLNVQNPHTGKTALHFLIQYISPQYVPQGSKESLTGANSLVASFIKQGANLSIKDKAGRSCIDLVPNIHSLF